jgi:hypothetical protein
MGISLKKEHTSTNYGGLAEERATNGMARGRSGPDARERAWRVAEERRTKKS